jgi:hypothetical protein
MSFATLQEAWGVATFGVEEVKPVNKQPVVQRKALEQAEGAQRANSFVTQYLQDVYKQHGIAAVLSLMDARMMHDLRIDALLSFDWLDSNSLMFLFMCVCGLWLVADLLRKR